MRVLFWGTPAFSLPALRALAGEGHLVVGVVTQPDRPAGRGRQLRMSPVKEFALSEGIPVLQPEQARGDDFLAELSALEPEVSVVVAYGQILRQEVLDLPPNGSVNIHASLLPELRGAAPVHWAIIRGLDTTGVTIMRMERGLDAGPILFQVPEPIRESESASELGARLAEIGAEALIDALAVLELGEMEEVPQDDSRATYAPKVDRDTARLDWELPAEELGRWIRGLDDAPGAWSLFGDEPVKLYCPTVEDGSGEPGEILAADSRDGLLVAAGSGAVRLAEVQPSGRRRMSAGDWVRGRGPRVGDRLQ